MTNPLHVACRRGHSNLVHFMVNQGVDPAAVDAAGRTCITHAAMDDGEMVAFNRVNQTPPPSLVAVVVGEAGYRRLHTAGAGGIEGYQYYYQGIRLKTLPELPGSVA